MYVGACVDMSVGVCVDMSVGVCVDMSVGMLVDMYVGMSLAMYVGVLVYISDLDPTPILPVTMPPYLNSDLDPTHLSYSDHDFTLIMTSTHIPISPVTLTLP